MPQASSRLSPQELLAALLVIVLWGLNFVPMKFALLEFSPFQIGAARFFLAAFPLVLFVARPAVPFKWLLMFVLTQGVGQFAFLFLALQLGMTAALASVLMQTQIFFTAVMGVLLLGESISGALKIGMGIAATGLALFVINLLISSDLGSVTGVGFLLTLSAAMMWSASNIIVKRMQTPGSSYSPLSLVAWSSLLSALGFMLISLLVDGVEAQHNWLQASLTSWISFLYLGWAASGLAYWLWTLLLTRHPASRVAPFSLGIPVVGLLAGIFVLGEQLTPLQWIGSALVMSALVVVVSAAQLSARKMARRYDRDL